MTKLDENLDPVVAAALIEQPDEDDDDKQRREELSKLDEFAEPEESEEDAAEEDAVEDTPKDEPTDEKEAPEVNEEAAEQIQQEDPRKPEKTRKEKREERKRAWLQSINEGNTPEQARAQALQADPSYKPLDYNQAEEFKTDELVADRTKFGETAFVQGATLEREIAQQERFWDKVGMESKVLAYDPKLQFLNEGNKEAYDPDKAADINQLYLNSIGYKETPVFQNGVAVHDPATGRQKMNITVGRTDLGYEQFVRGFVDMMEDWAGEAQADTVKNIVKQKSNQGIRPGGTSKRGVGTLRPGDISKMSEEDYQKYEDDIDQKILQML